ncbi:hypothetical protein P3L10_031262 [Capsicum annuum]
MNYKKFSCLFIAYFILIFCLLSTTSSRRLLQSDDNGDYNNNNGDYNNNNDDYNAVSPSPDYVGIPMRRSNSKPDHHSATGKHPPPTVRLPPERCSGLNREVLAACIRRQVNNDLCKTYNIC